MAIIMKLFRNVWMWFKYKIYSLFIVFIQNDPNKKSSRWASNIKIIINSEKITENDDKS
jgi:hypothetical protein